MTPLPSVHLLDTNAIIEAVRIGVWNALTGRLSIETVEECAAECRRGERLSGSYVAVGDEVLGRLAALRAVSDTERATLTLHEDASALDPGELDLFAHAFGRDAAEWTICSPDRAAVRLGVALGWQDRLVSLEQLIAHAGGRPDPALRSHFSSAWLSVHRTRALLDG